MYCVVDIQAKKRERKKLMNYTEYPTYLPKKFKEIKEEISVIPHKNLHHVSRVEMPESNIISMPEKADNLFSLEIKVKFPATETTMSL